VPERQSFPDKEEEILKWWEENDTFKESVRLSKGRKRWSFYDGPPFATGLPHYGHILAGTIKVRCGGAGRGRAGRLGGAHLLIGRVRFALSARVDSSGHCLPLRAPDRPLRGASVRLGLPRSARRV
jgi:hypothetical protein